MSRIKSRLEEDASAFADEAHVGILRNYTNEPYVVHTRAVADIVAEFDDDPEVLAAAQLHDTVEDTDTTLEQLEQKFGKNVACYVSWLSDRSRPQDGSRKVRKAIDRAVLALAPAKVQNIKVADMMHNTLGLVANNPAFAVTYLPEKAALLEVLTAAHPVLLARAKAMVDEALAELAASNPKKRK